jgi:molecular chaperone DnaK (HSP70)
MAKVEVSFDLDANGILNVSAKDLGTGKEQKIRIESNSGLSDADIQRMKDEAKANEEADKIEADRIITLNAADNKRLGVFSLDIIPCPKGMAKIEVSFDLDANGILNVSAKDLGTGKEQKIRIESNSGLSDADIQRMKDEAKANEEADKAEADRIITLNSADSAIFNCDKQLEELGDKMTETQKVDVENAKTALKDALDRKSVEDCKAAMENLQKIWMEVGKHIYSQSNGSGDGQQDFVNDLNDIINGQKKA